MNTKTMIAICALVALAPGSALAHGHVLATVETPTAFDIDGATYYLYEEDLFVSLWKETNGITYGGEVTLPELGHEETGLQTEDFCILEDGSFDHAEDDGTCHEGEFVPADTRIGAGNFNQEVLGGLLP